MIIHKVIKKDGRLRYLCNQACSITRGKFTIINGKVTCENCLRKLKKEVDKK